jgi:hypothetical protein
VQQLLVPLLQRAGLQRLPWCPELLHSRRAKVPELLLPAAAGSKTLSLNTETLLRHHGVALRH